MIFLGGALWKLCPQHCDSTGRPHPREDIQMFFHQLIISGGYFLTRHTNKYPEHGALLRGLEEEEDADACTEDGIKGSLQKRKNMKQLLSLHRGQLICKYLIFLIFFFCYSCNAAARRRILCSVTAPNNIPRFLIKSQALKSIGKSAQSNTRAQVIH